MGGGEVIWPRGSTLFGSTRTRPACGGDLRIRGAIPIFGRIGDTPHIAMIVERDADQEIFAVVAERQTVCHAAGRGCTVRQIAKQDRGFNGQGLRCAQSAALRAYDQSDTLRRERMPAIHAGEEQ